MAVVQLEVCVRFLVKKKNSEHKINLQTYLGSSVAYDFMEKKEENKFHYAFGFHMQKMIIPNTNQFG